MKNLLKFDFNIGGFIGGELTNDEFFPLLEEINEAQDNFENTPTFNSNLVGQLKHEYKLDKNHKQLEIISTNLAEEYCRVYNYGEGMVASDLVLSDYWVNFQRKHEFNPLHTHNGEFVFVIFAKIPYTIEEEKNATSYVRSQINLSANFVFQYTNMLGRITTFEMPADKTYEKRIILFPAALHHAVYPFYSTDDFRVTVSGNLFLRPKT
jgi:hypothetical protein